MDSISRECELGGTIYRRSGVEKDVLRQYLDACSIQRDPLYTSMYFFILKCTKRSRQEKAIKKKYSDHNFILMH
jgi:hypothetical protein